jgi:hypothetical protein
VGLFWFFVRGFDLERTGLFAAAASLLLLLLEAPGALRAEERAPMFPRDSAKTIFDHKIYLTPQKGYSILLPQQKKAEDTFAQPSGQAPLPPENSNAAAPPPVNPSEPGRELTPQEKIAKEFGDPFDPFPVKGIDTAPKPYRAAIAALEIGDEELAAKYMIQYERYQKRLEDIQNKLVAIEGQVMMKEDMLPAGAWPDGEEYKEFRYLRDLDFREQDKEKQKEMELDRYRGELDSKARQAIARAKQSQYELLPEEAAPVADSLNEKEERANARRLLAGRVPVDPLGKVDVYFFFRPYNKDAIAMAPDLERLYQSVKQDPKVNIAAFAMGTDGAGAVHGFKRDAKLSVPLMKGTMLAQRLNVSVSPTMVFLTQTKSKPHYEEGLRNFYFMDELLKIMQGK